MGKRPEEVLWVTCPRCKNEWAPDARRWKNLNNLIRTGRKAVYCPACNKRVLLSKTHTVYLMRQRQAKKKKRKRLRKHAKESTSKL